MTIKKYDSAVISDSYAYASGETRSADIVGYHSPAVCVSLDDLGGLTDETITIEIVGDAATYQADERTLSSAGTYIVDIPQAIEVQVTSSGGATISAEARNNPR